VKLHQIDIYGTRDVRFGVACKRPGINDEKFSLSKHSLELLSRDNQAHCAARLFNGGNIIYFCTGRS